MTRKEFLATIGLGTVAVLCASCIGGCKATDQGPTAPANVDFTVDLSNPTFSGLAALGGFTYSSGVIVAHTPSGYVAVSAACTHQGATITYDRATNLFYCPAHGSTFSPSGVVTRGPAGSPLVSYRVALTGNSLRVYS
jgi:cytochrome b6-f complex iron-sulfur subunit